MSMPVERARPMPVRAELEPLMAMLFLRIDEMGSVVIHVSAASHGEGTTTIAREIAAAATVSGWCKVALIDAGATASQILGGVSGPNLVEQVERGAEPVLRASRIGAAPVATGRLSGVPGIARLDSVRKLYGILKATYNLVVVDCPPVITDQQTATLASAADGTVLVVEAERTRIDEANRAREVLDQLGATILGVVFNKRRRRIPRLISRFI